MNAELNQDSFRHANGNIKTIEYRNVKSLQKSYGFGEGSIDLVEASFGNRTRTFVTKKIGRPLFAPEHLTNANNQAEKWRELKAAGVSVTPTFRVNTAGTTILSTDLTQNGRVDFFDPTTYKRSLNSLVGSSIDLPQWVSTYKEEIFEGIATCSKKAASVGYRIYPDSYFFTFDRKSETVRVVVGDLGQGIEKVDPERNKTHLLSIANIQWGLLSLLQADICTVEEYTTAFEKLSGVKMRSE